MMAAAMRSCRPPLEPGNDGTDRPRIPRRRRPRFDPLDVEPRCDGPKRQSLSAEFTDALEDDLFVII